MSHCPYRSCRTSGQCIYPERAKELDCPKYPLCSDEEYAVQEEKQLHKGNEILVKLRPLIDKLRND